MGFTLKKSTGHAVIDTGAILDAIVPLVIGDIKSRVDDGIDANGQPFAPYSPGYLARLQAAGKDTSPDLRVSGGMLKGLTETARTETESSSTAIIAPDTRAADSERFLRPKGEKRRKGEALEFTNGPPHNIVGLWHQEGIGRNPVRKWLGLSPEQRKHIAKAIGKANGVKRKPGGK